MNFTDAITWNGKHSYNDFGLTIKTPSGDIPKIKDVKVSVPYMNGDYDFTFANGEPAYSARVIKIVFNIEGEDPEDLYRQRMAVCEWIMSQQGGNLYFDSIPGWHYKDVTARITDYNDRVRRTVARITAEFTCYPLLISNRIIEGYYAATSTLTEHIFELPEKATIPEFTTTAACLVRWKDVDYTIPANSVKYKLSDIKFERGVNTFKIQGTSELKITCYKEAL